MKLASAGSLPDFIWSQQRLNHQARSWSIPSEGVLAVLGEVVVETAIPAVYRQPDSAYLGIAVIPRRYALLTRLGGSMSSLYLNKLSTSDRLALVNTLHAQQHGNCFICGKEVDLAVHADTIDIDHVIPLKVGGKDDPSNFALAHASCNRAKQASDLRVARVLHRFEAIKGQCAAENRAPNHQRKGTRRLHLGCRRAQPDRADPRAGDGWGDPR